MDALKNFPYPDRRILVDAMADNILILAVLGFIVMAVTTRVASGVLGSSKKTPRGDTVPLAPYWIPIIGHIPSFLIWSKPFFSWARRTYPGGAFAINMGGTTHNIIFRPSFGHMLMNQKNEVADSASVARYLICALFCYPKSELDVYDRSVGELLICYNQLLSNPGLSRLIDSFIGHMKANINSLITLNESPVDLSPWERTANVQASIEDQSEVVSLLPLIQNFVAAATNSAIFSDDFLPNNPSFYRDIWLLDRAFMPLAASLPRWLPIPSLTQGALARARIMHSLTDYEKALDSWAAGDDVPPEWSSIDTASDLIKARVAIYRKYDLSMTARAAIDMGLFWASNANSNPLVFWVIIRVYSDPTLLARIREEVAPYVRVRVPDPGEFGPGRELPSLEDIDHEALADRCPYLKAAYVESLRLDSAPWSFKIMRDDVTLSERRGKAGSSTAAGEDAQQQQQQRYLLRKGTFCHVAHELHHRNGDHFPDPDEWDVSRHIRHEKGEDGQERIAKVELGTVRPYGGGQSMCKGRAFALKEVLICTAAIFTFYDMEPEKKGAKWVIPKVKKTTGTNSVSGDYRVRIRRRGMRASS